MNFTRSDFRLYFVWKKSDKIANVNSGSNYATATNFPSNLAFADIKLPLLFSSLASSRIPFGQLEQASTENFRDKLSA